MSKVRLDPWIKSEDDEGMVGGDLELTNRIPNIKEGKHDRH